MLEMVADKGVLLATIFVGLATALVCAYFVLIRRSSRKVGGPPSVIIVGPANAGKTGLFQLLTAPEEVKETVLSVKPNHSSTFTALDNAELVDVPGHEKLQQYTKDALSQTNLRAVIFMVDASSGVAGIQAAAERLFTVLEITEQRVVPVLIAANKFDLFNTLSLKKITAILEESLNSIRDTRAHTVPNSEEDSSWQEQERAFIGLDGKQFQFSDLESEVAIIEGSVKTRKISKWEDWLASAAGA